MNLPYGTMKDKEMKALRVDIMQDEGLIFLWVTGRAMELARDCLNLWYLNLLYKYTNNILKGL
jgi:mRNA (2'-O-methyladenosine-N6-)-methyltransferase